MPSPPGISSAVYLMVPLEAPASLAVGPPVLIMLPEVGITLASPSAKKLFS